MDKARRIFLLLFLLSCSVYIFAYVSVRNIFVLDNMFVAVIYSERSGSVYSLIELYYKNDPDNRASVPTDTKINIYDLEDVDVLNIYESSREVVPSTGWLLPFLFYPIEKIEIKYLTKKSG